MPIPNPVRHMTPASPCPLGTVLRRVDHGSRCVSLGKRPTKGETALEDPVDRACAEYASARHVGKGDPTVTASGDAFCGDAKRYGSGDPDADARWVHGLARDLNR
jgi:hypothetical protein